jgi:prolyl oligopeptidase
MRFSLLIAMTILLTACAATPPAPPADSGKAAIDQHADPNLWLEDVESPKALDWAKARNAETQATLEADPRFEPIQNELRAVLDSNERLAYVQKLGAHYYNFWRDAKNERGLWRRTTLQSYLSGSPTWETVLDLDVLGANEKENWVWKGAACLHPNAERCLLNLSRGGADAVVIREFDTVAKSFVEGDGFFVAEAKTQIDYLDRDTVLIGSDFGPGSLTTSGYARTVKRWARGTPLAQATLVFEGETTDVSASGTLLHTRGKTYEVYQRSPDFFTNQTFVRRSGNLVKIDKPDDADAQAVGSDMLVTLRSAWTVGGQTYPKGALIAIDIERFFGGARDFAVLFEPTERSSLAGIDATRDFVLLNVLDNVRNRLYSLKRINGEWVREALATPGMGTVGVGAIDDERSNDYFLTVEDFLTPVSLYYGEVGEREQQLVDQLPAFFNAAGLEITQSEAISADSERIPYFMVAKKGLPLDRSHPTLLYAYGGFEVSMLPRYSGGLGRAWLERGGVYVLANIRGGGEFGPRWHQAALKANRQRAFDDFIAVAENLIERGVTQPKHLGIQGGSNGGLLMGVMLTQRPDLFGAIVCQVPLLDMQRYHLLLAGASWIGEYGDPSQPEQWAYLSKYSPYQRLDANAKYPPTLVTTSTRDDRVHPGHARKLVARMLEQGHPVKYYENIEGGHGGAANNQQRAFMDALAYTFLWRELDRR